MKQALRSFWVSIFSFAGALLVCCAFSSTYCGATPPVAFSTEMLEGHVFLADGRPAAKAEVFVVHQWFERDVSEPTLTDNAGYFQVKPQAPDDKMFIVRSLDGDITFASMPSKGPGTITFGALTEVRIPFVDATGHPLVGCKVALLPSTDSTPVRGIVMNRGFPNFPETLKAGLMGTTDAMGLLTLEGLPQGGRVSITVQLSDQQRPMLLGGSLLLAKQPTFRAAPIHVSLTGSISGRVTYRQSGKPVQKAVITLTGPGYHNFMGMARTDANGRYQFQGLAPARYDVSMQNMIISETNGLKARPNAEETVYRPLRRFKQGAALGPAEEYAPVEVGLEEKVTGADFTLVRSAVVQGVVLEASGRPVFGPEVNASYEDGGGEGRPVEIDGTYRFVVPPGKVRISLDKEFALDDKNAPAWMTLAEGETRTIDFDAGGAQRAASRLLARRGRALAPDLTAEDSDGLTVALSDFRGKVVILDFWFPSDDDTPMPPSLSTTNSVVKTLGSRGVVALAVDTQEAKDPFDQWVRKHPDLKSIRFARDTSDTHMTGEGIITTHYRVYGVPVRFIIAPDGTLFGRYLGEEVNDTVALRRAVFEALEHKQR